jgi:thiamine transport system permease protein
VFVIAGNALLALPFAARALSAPMTQVLARDDKLCASLGISGWARLWLIDWPQLKRPMALAFVLAVMVSFGDFGIIAFFGADNFITLPYLLYLQLGSYRSADAAGLALILFGLALVLAFIANRTQGQRA